MAHAVDGQRVTRRNDERRHRREAGHRAETGQIGGDVDAVYAGALLGGDSVDPLDDRVGVRRAQNVAPQRTGTVDVGEVPAAAGQEAKVFEAPDGSADIRAHAPYLAHSRWRVTSEQHPPQGIS